MFQSAPPRGGRSSHDSHDPGSKGFQSAPPRGGRCRAGHVQACHRCFNPRPRVGGDLFAKAGRCERLRFQSAPPRGGRYDCHHSLARCRGVSIRAPAWGVIRNPPRCPQPIRRFNPRPRVGGDLIPRFQPSSRLRFQSAPPRGGRFHRHYHNPKAEEVSIRAPAWGAIKVVPLPTIEVAVSIRAPAWGAILRHRRWEPRWRSFNPRPRVGGDNSERVPWNCVGSFNPRPRVGGDL